MPIMLLPLGKGATGAHSRPSAALRQLLPSLRHARLGGDRRGVTAAASATAFSLLVAVGEAHKRRRRRPCSLSAARLFHAAEAAGLLGLLVRRVGTRRGRPRSLQDRK